jgi:polyhydroxyalkanoate synthesis regulator phasin
MLAFYSNFHHMKRKTLDELGLVAVGSAILASREFERITNEFLRDSGASKAEGQLFFRKLKRSIESKRTEAVHNALEVIAELAGLEIVSKKDFKRLEKRLVALEKKKGRKNG